MEALEAEREARVVSQDGPQVPLNQAYPVMQLQPLSDLDTEAKAQNEHLLTTARMQLEEQEDEIKALNEMILQVCLVGFGSHFL
jgi:hypothetical protein